MVVRKNIYGIVIIVIILLIAVPILIKRDKEAKKDTLSLEVSGEVHDLIHRIKGEKGIFILVNSCWYNIIHYETQMCLEKGDYIDKRDANNCLTVVKNLSEPKEFCRVIIHKVEDSRLQSKIDHEKYKVQMNSK